MPVYDYLCSSCGPFEQRRPMRESSEPVPCTHCQASAPRIVSAPRLNLMLSANRIVETRNEKSAHAPDVVHTLKPHDTQSHPRHHDHVHAHTRRPSASGRPWMVGHY